MFSLLWLLESLMDPGPAAVENHHVPCLHPTPALEQILPSQFFLKNIMEMTAGRAESWFLPWDITPVRRSDIHIRHTQ